LILGQSDFVEQARGVVWDLRRAAEGVIEPVDFMAEAEGNLNVRLINQLLSDCPDLELRDHLQYGVDYKADLALQVVLLPHMSSLAPCVDLIELELERLIDSKWHELFPTLPFLPLRLSPKGAVTRKFETSAGKTSAKTLVPSSASGGLALAHRPQATSVSAWRTRCVRFSRGVRP